MDNELIEGHIGGMVRQTRKLRGISQKRLGEMLGLTFQQVQKYETGKNRISAGTLYRISDFLKVDIACFYKGIGKPGKDTSRIPPAILAALWKLHEIQNPNIRESVSRLITVLHRELPPNTP